jgi:hypothetical protein
MNGLESSGEGRVASIEGGSKSRSTRAGACFSAPFVFVFVFVAVAVAVPAILPLHLHRR